MVVGQVLAIAVIVLGTGELIAAIAGGQRFSNVLFGIFGWLLGWGSWREHQTRRRSPAAVQTWETVEFWIGVVAAVALAIWATMSFAMPAFPVLTSGKGFESRAIGYLAKIFLLWFALLAYCAGLFVSGSRQKFFTVATGTYIVACGILLLLFTPFSEGVGHLRTYAENEPQKILVAAAPSQPAPSNVNQPGPSAPPTGTAQPEPPPPSNVAEQPPQEMIQPQPEPGQTPQAGEQPPPENALPQVAWQVVADPDLHPPVQPWIRQPAIPVPSSTDLAWPRANSPMIAVLNRNQSEPSAQLWDLSTACGKGLIRGTFDFKEAIVLSRDGKYLGGNGEYGTEVWSFENGKLLARLPLDKRNGDVPVDFLADQSILMLGNTPKSAQYKIWTFVANPKVQKVDLPDGVIVDNRAAAVSPGRRYLATFGQGIVWIVDLQKGELCGMLPVVKPDEPQGGNTEVDLCFSPDGQELAGIFGSNQVPRLKVWSLSDGSQKADFELPEGIVNRDRGRVLECFPDNQGWLVDGRMLVDRNGQAWPIIGHELRILGLLDNDHTIVTNDQMLSTWTLTRQADGRLKLATLEIQHDDLPGVMYSRDIALSGDALSRASRRYRSQTEIDVLAAPDSVLLQTLRWCPVLKQPMLGVRWGSGVVTQAAPGTVAQPPTPGMGRIEDQVGALGTAVVSELQNRIDSGAFGQAPQVGDPRLSEVMYLGSGTRNDLLNLAKSMGLNAVVLFQLPQPPPSNPPPAGKRPDDQTKIYLIDVSSKAQQWERTAPNTSPSAMTGEPDPEEIALCADDLGKFLNDSYVLQPLPEVQPGDIPARIKTLTTEAHDDRLPLFAEVRYDQLKGLLSSEDAVAAFRKWLNSEQAQVMATGTPAQRRAMLEQWSKSSRN